MFGKYSFQNVMNVYIKNKPLIDAYINGESVEGLNEDCQKSDEVRSYGGFAMLIVIMVIHLLLFILAIYAIVTHWKRLPGWAKGTSILLLFTGGSIFSLILVYFVIYKDDERDEYEGTEMDTYHR